MESVYSVKETFQILISTVHKYS